MPDLTVQEQEQAGRLCGCGICLGGHGFLGHPEECKRATRIATAFADQREPLVAALDHAREVFVRYAAMHMKKGTDAGKAKALANAEEADRCAAAIRRGE